LKYTPEKLYLEGHTNYSYACKPCKPEGRKTPEYMLFVDTQKTFLVTIRMQKQLIYR